MSSYREEGKLLLQYIYGLFTTSLSRPLSPIMPYVTATTNFNKWSTEAISHIPLHAASTHQKSNLKEINIVLHFNYKY